MEMTYGSQPGSPTKRKVTATTPANLPPKIRKVRTIFSVPHNFSSEICLETALIVCQTRHYPHSMLFCHASFMTPFGMGLRNILDLLNYWYLQDLNLLSCAYTSFSVVCVVAGCSITSGPLHSNKYQDCNNACNQSCRQGMFIQHTDSQVYCDVCMNSGWMVINLTPPFLQTPKKATKNPTPRKILADQNAGVGSPHGSETFLYGHPDVSLASTVSTYSEFQVCTFT